MTHEGEALVRGSWPRIASGGTALAERFYARLFEIAPEQRELFVTTDMAKQQEKFLVMLQAIVARLDAPEDLVPDVAALGFRHVEYGVSARGYQVVGDALIWALEQELGPDLTPELRQAWIDAYRLLARLMERGALLYRRPA
jgi:hemoglobin-like flavoprotein